MDEELSRELPGFVDIERDFVRLKFDIYLDEDMFDFSLSQISMPEFAYGVREYFRTSCPISSDRELRFDMLDRISEVAYALEGNDGMIVADYLRMDYRQSTDAFMYSLQRSVHSDNRDTSIGENAFATALNLLDRIDQNIDLMHYVRESIESVYSLNLKSISNERGVLDTLLASDKDYGLRYLENQMPEVSDNIGNVSQIDYEKSKKKSKK
ncbi:MAG: hypothetical protein ACI83O_000228 [Patescibacteria group bacterium]|jgi:hypothetical protein